MKDHREIGRELDLFMFSELSPGCPIWLHNGNVVYSILQDKIRALQKEYGYSEVRTPMIWKSELYKTSGHWDHYKEFMFGLHGKEEDVLWILKPMNCPGHMEIFRSKSWSINDLPYRMADQGVLHRDEVSGAIGGLTRCREFCQDDAHIFLAPHQVQEELKSLAQMVHRVYSKLNMQVRSVVSTRPKDFMGAAEDWDNAEAALKNASPDASIEEGAGAFYGPKIDFFVKDSFDREWQTATFQLDFQLPKKFKLEYTDHDNTRKEPVVIHRALYGSFERFIGVLLEHYQGHLPLWLAPVQYAILTITDKQKAYAEKLKNGLENRGLRSVLDNSNNRLPQKIAIAQSAYTPKMVVIGDNEVTNELVTVRNSDGKNETLPKRDFFALAMAAADFGF
jgi:threonyl-tRNA synthetase